MLRPRPRPGPTTRRQRRPPALFLLLGLSGCAGSLRPERGAVVEALESWGGAAEAGIELGDVLVAWSRAGESAGTGRLLSPLDVTRLEREESPRGPISLRLWRSGTQLELTLARGEWGMSTHPVLSLADRERHEDASRLAAKGEPQRAAEEWEALATKMTGSERVQDAIWFRLLIGRAYAEAHEVEAARSAFARARESLADADPRARALTVELEGEALFGMGEYAAASEALADAVTLLETSAPASPALAWSLRELGRCRFRYVDLDGAEESLSRALRLYREAGSAALESSDVLNLLAGVVYRRGDLDEAQKLYLEALALREPVSPDSPRMGGLDANLGLVAYDRGDFDGAERFLLRAVAIDDRVAPDPGDAGYTWNFLGLLSRDKGDFESARAYYQRALASFRTALPGGLEVAGMLTNLGNLSLREGDLAAAERDHREALAIREGLLEENLDVAASLHNLASVFRLKGELGEARPLLDRALEIKNQVAPRSLLVATTLYELGEVCRAEGATREAEQFHRRALDIRRSAAPEGDVTAQSMFALGKVAREAGRGNEAERRWREAIALVESPRGRLAFTTAERSRFSARFYELYQELAELLAETGRAREAFDLMERARARALRVMMAQRDFARSAGVPAELILERRRLEQSRESAESRLARMSVAVRDELVPLHERLRELRRQLDELNERIRKTSPRLMLLEDPEPVPIDDVRRTLSRGTLLLSYSVGSERTLLFTVGSEADGPDVAVKILPFGEKELERRVEIFRAFIERGVTVAEVEPALLDQGRSLYQQLLAPVEESVAAAERIVVISEGPLLTLPFAALVRSVDPPEYLFQWKPLSHTASAGVLAELRLTRPDDSDAGHAGQVGQVGQGGSDCGVRGPGASPWGPWGPWGRWGGSNRTASFRTRRSGTDRRSLRLPRPGLRRVRSHRGACALARARAAAGSLRDPCVSRRTLPARFRPRSLAR